VNSEGKWGDWGTPVKYESNKGREQGKEKGGKKRGKIGSTKINKRQIKQREKRKVLGRLNDNVLEELSGREKLVHRGENEGGKKRKRKERGRKGQRKLGGGECWGKRLRKQSHIHITSREIEENGSIQRQAMSSIRPHTKCHGRAEQEQGEGVKQGSCLRIGGKKGGQKRKKKSAQAAMVPGYRKQTVKTQR